MNKTLLSAALIAGFGIAALVPQVARAADGTITITGKVVANTCTFNVNGGGSNPTVVLPVVFYTDLSTAGSSAGTTPISIVVAGCDSTLTSVQEKFGGANILADGNLGNTGSAGTNVEVRLTTSGGTAINLNSNGGLANSPVETLSTGGATMTFNAQYYAPAALTAADVGTVNTSVTYTTQYL